MSDSILLLFHAQDKPHFVSVMYAYVSFLTHSPVNSVTSGAQGKISPKVKSPNQASLTWSTQSQIGKIDLPVCEKKLLHLRSLFNL